jgi:hypothetical protein
MQTYGSPVNWKTEWLRYVSLCTLKAPIQPAVKPADLNRLLEMLRIGGTRIVPSQLISLQSPVMVSSVPGISDRSGNLVIFQSPE